MASPPQPIAHGSLERTPLAHVLVSIWHRGLVGTLAVWAPGGQSGQDRIYCAGGNVRKARLLGPSGDLMRGLLPLFRRQATYAFYDLDLVGEGQLEGQIDIRALVAAGLRGGIPDTASKVIFERFEAHKLRISREADLGAFDFIPKERAFLDMFRAEPTSIEGAIAAAGSAKIARRVLYALAIFKTLETFSGQHDRQSFTELSRSAEEFRRTRSSQQMKAATASTPASTPPASTPAPLPEAPPSHSGSLGSEPGGPPEAPAGLSEELQAQWRNVADRWRAIYDQTYFEMLDVGRSAGPEEVRDAYFQQVKRWHPDRLPPDLAPLRAWADEIFQQLTTAHETLADTEERGKYLKSVQSGGGTPRADRELQTILGAAMEFQKVEVLIRRREWKRAEGLARELLTVVPDEADYHAALGLILWSASPEDRGDEALAFLDRALELNQEHERALLTKARLLERRGDKMAAIRLFEQVAELNPKNVEAQRQVRLARMRGQDTGSHRAPKAPKKDPGLLGKLFGGKK